MTRKLDDVMINRVILRKISEFSTCISNKSTPDEDCGFSFINPQRFLFSLSLHISHKPETGTNALTLSRSCLVFSFLMHMI